MDKVYRYIAKDSYGDTRKGVVVGGSKDEATATLVRAGLRPNMLSLDLGRSLSVMTSREIAPRELGRFYRSMGNRIKAGSNIVDGIQRMAEFTDDVRMETALSLAAEAMRNGMSLGEAMRTAGLPERDAMAVSAMEHSGQIDEIFQTLSEDVTRAGELKRKINRIIYIPLAFLFLAYAMVYGATAFLTPKMLAKVTEIVGADKLPPFSRRVYEFTDWANNNLIIYTAIYVAVGVAVVMFFRNQRIKRFFVRKIGILEKLSQFADHARLWRSFALLYEAGTNPASSAEMIGKGAMRDENRLNFSRMGAQMRTGMDLGEAVRRSNFPEFVISSVSAAATQHGNVPDTLIRFSDELYEDVDVLSGKLQDQVTILMTFFMGFVLLAFFLFTYYPMLAAVMSQL